MLQIVHASPCFWILNNKAKVLFPFIFAPAHCVQPPISSSVVVRAFTNYSFVLL